MSEEVKVITATLNRLYQRIATPTAGDAASLRIALKALKLLEMSEKPAAAPKSPVKAPEPVAPVNEPVAAPETTTEGIALDGLSIAALQALVEGGRVTVEQALDFEEEQGAPRKTLIKWLEERL